MPEGPSPAGAAHRLYAVGGAVAFLMSLGYFAYLYAIPMGQAPAAGSAPVFTAAWKNLLLFAVFASHHSLAARDPVKRWTARLMTPALERSTYVWIASALFFLVCRLWVPAGGPVLYEAHGGLRVLGYAVQLLGLGLIGRASGRLDTLALAGLRPALGDAPARLRTDGPYGWVRHPVYLGWVLVVFGAPVMTPSRSMVAVISSLYLLVAVPWEERALALVCGERYRQYRREVRWRVVPYLY